MTSSAQQQTGAPAGIAVPAPPPVEQATPPTGIAPASRVFRVRVADGRNGTPIHDAHVQLWYDEPSGPGYTVATDAHGYALMPAPVGVPVRVLLRSVNFTDCRRPARYALPEGYNLQQIATSGVSAENTCGNVRLHTAPGELLLFVRPSRWYENLNRTPQ